MPRNHLNIAQNRESALELMLDFKGFSDSCNTLNNEMGLRKENFSLARLAKSSFCNSDKEPLGRYALIGSSCDDKD